jgi:hypothetical protein
VVCVIGDLNTLDIAENPDMVPSRVTPIILRLFSHALI